MKKRVRKDPETRRAELIDAAANVFGNKGFESTAVSDIVREAGVAQGTFYLYFETKNDIVNALVDRMIEGVVASLEEAMDNSSADAVGRFHALFDTFLTIAEQPAAYELTEVYHRKENREVHEQMARRILPRLLPIVEGIIVQGVEEGKFHVTNPHLAAWFVIGGISNMEHGMTDRDDVPAMLQAAVEFALRSLGYQFEEAK